MWHQFISDGGVVMLQKLHVVLEHGLGLFFREILDNFKGHFVVIALIISVNVM